MKMKVSSFYKYVRIANPSNFRKRHQEYCDRLGIKGKVLVAEEGINGSVSGTEQQISRYKKHLHANKLFRNVVFKDTAASSHPYKRMVVRVRAEIVTFGKNTDLRMSGRRITPRTLNSWIKKGDVVLVDVRNNYESRIGKFAGAVTLDMDTFREFPGSIRRLKKYRTARIVTYCTGGIRCEKASALLKENGFESIYQLQDGILNYAAKYPDSHFNGRCFVFDFRLSVPTGTADKKLSKCELCHVPSYEYLNCSSNSCDRLFISCKDCRSVLGGACSKKCRARTFQKVVIK